MHKYNLLALSIVNKISKRETPAKVKVPHFYDLYKVQTKLRSYFISARFSKEIFHEKKARSCTKSSRMRLLALCLMTLWPSN